MAGRQGFITNHETYIYQESPDLPSAAIGIDSQDNYIWKVKASQLDNALPTGVGQFEIDSRANGNVTVTPNGNGSLVSAKHFEVSTAGLTVVAGSTTLTPLAAATAGIVTKSTTGVLGAIENTSNDGYLLISKADASAPIWAALTAGSGITITPGANSITIAAPSPVLTWNAVPGASVALVANNGYMCDGAVLTTATLPVTCAKGQVIRISATGAGMFTIAQNAGQTIKLGSFATTPGVTGSIEATAQYDALELLCIVADTAFQVISSVGNFNLI